MLSSIIRPTKNRLLYFIIRSSYLTLLFITIFHNPVQSVRIKDIATFSGVRNNQLIGYGLVIGLAGTGDKRDSPFTASSMKNMLEYMDEKSGFLMFWDDRFVLDYPLSPHVDFPFPSQCAFPIKTGESLLYVKVLNKTSLDLVFYSFFTL